MIGWTCALVAIAVYYFTVINWPNNVVPTVLILTVAAVGLAPPYGARANAIKGHLPK